MQNEFNPEQQQLIQEWQLYSPSERSGQDKVMLAAIEKFEQLGLGDHPVCAKLHGLMAKQRRYDHEGFTHHQRQALEIYQQESLDSAGARAAGDSLIEYYLGRRSSQERHSEGIAFLEELVQQCTEKLDADNEYPGELSLFLGTIYCGINRFLDAEKAFSFALERISKHHARVGAEVASIYLLLGQTQHQLGKLAEAQDCLEKALEGCITAGGLFSTGCVAAMNALIAVNLATGNKEESYQQMKLLAHIARASS